MAPSSAQAVSAERPERMPSCSDVYGEAELDVVLRRGEWHSWHDAIEWLQSDGMDDGELSAECAQALLGDFEMLERSNVSFTPVPYLALLLIRSHR